jgi:hypothetical protein
VNSERTEAYLQLIQSLLNCDSGEEAAILAANKELLDSGLLESVFTQSAFPVEWAGTQNHLGAL